MKGSIDGEIAKLQKKIEANTNDYKVYEKLGTLYYKKAKILWESEGETKISLDLHKEGDKMILKAMSMIYTPSS